MATTLYYESEDKESYITLQLDLIPNADTRMSNLITELPIESGKSVNDNIVAEPSTFSLDAIVSNMIDEEGRAREQPSLIWLLLQRLTRENRILTLVDELGSQNNLVIEELGRKENFMTGNSLQVHISLKQLTLIDVQFSAITREKVADTPLEVEQKEKAPNPRGLTDEELADERSFQAGQPAANKTSTTNWGVLTPQDIDDLPFDIFENASTEPLSTL